jgi:hypothetical protein
VRSSEGLLFAIGKIQSVNQGKMKVDNLSTIIGYYFLLIAPESRLT